MIDSDKIIEIKKSVSLVSIIGQVVKLKKRGNKYFGLCPFHPDTDPSLVVYPQTNSWFCFGCEAGRLNRGISGDVIGFVMAFYKLNFPDAVNWIEKNGVTDFRTEGSVQIDETVVNFKMNRIAVQFYHSMLPETYNRVIAEKFKVGFAHGGRVLMRHLLKNGFRITEIVDSKLVAMRELGLTDYFWGSCFIFPHFVDGEVVGFTMKDPDESRSIRIRIGKCNHFYNQDILKSVSKVVIVEGENDLFKLFLAGVENVIALCGLYFSDVHVSILEKYGIKEVVLALDPDKAGKETTEEIAVMLKDFVVIKTSFWL